MPIYAITELRHGQANKDGNNEVLVFEPGEEVKGVPDAVLLDWAATKSVLVVGKEKDLMEAAIGAKVPVQEPPIYSAADPRYLARQVEQRKAAEKAEEDRLKAFRAGKMGQEPPVNQNLPKGSSSTPSGATGPSSPPPPPAPTTAPTTTPTTAPPKP